MTVSWPSVVLLGLLAALAGVMLWVIRDKNAFLARTPALETEADLAAFKIKVGRGSKWMPRKEGDERDVEVVKVIRKHAGKDVLLMVDANNGYDLAGAKRFMDRVGGEDLAFVEELFPEVVEQCLELKRYMKDNGWKTLLADGETQGDLNVFKPFLAAGAIDVYQADMNRFGFEGILT